MNQRYESSAVPSKRTGAFYAAYFGVLGVVLPFLGPFLAGRGLGAVAVGLVTAAFSLAKLGYAPFLGRWVDRGRWLPGMLTLHMGMSVIAMLMVATSSDPWVLGAALLIVGLGYGTVLPLVEAAVLERPPVKGYGFVRWWGSAGFILCASLSAVVLGANRIDRFPLVMAASLVVLGIIAATLENEARPRHEPGKGEWVGGRVWALLTVLTLQQVSHGPYYGFFSIHLTSHGFGSGMVAGLWSLAVLVELVAFFSGGAIQRRISNRALLGIALGLTPLRWLLLALPPSLPVLAMAQAGHAVSFALAHLAGIQLVQELVPPNARRNAQALYSGLTFGLGIVVGTAAAGPLYAALSGSGSFLVAAGFSVVVAVVWFVAAPKIAKP
ncbi:MAG: MFS transporter [Thermoanaerobaculales bacterium]|nr:MFS transporter [Thermoanaerobaculales bacterium]